MENKCRRCGRKLSDPRATYGWRCAEKLGVAESLSQSPYDIFVRFTEGVEKAMRLFKGSNIGSLTSKMYDIVASTVKEALWDGVDDSKKKKARKELYSTVDGTVSSKKKKFDINADIDDITNFVYKSFNDFADAFNEKASDAVNNIVGGASKKLAKHGKLDNISNGILGMEDAASKSILRYAKDDDIAKSNYEYNSTIDLSKYDGKYINDQNTGPVSQLKFGNRQMYYNGCEIIATYNALRTLGKPEDIRDIAYEYEKDGKMLGGEFGTNPYAAQRYFERKGYEVETVKGEDIVNKKTPDADAYILSYWNTDNVMEMLHTVAIEKDKNGEYVFYNDDGETENEAKSDKIRNRIKKEKYQPVILQCISAK